VTLTTPAQGASYAQNAVVNASYSCADETALSSCIGDTANGAPINTATLGNHTFTVTATDAAGNIGTAMHDYVVVDVTAPSISIAGPADGAVYTLNQVATASYSCADEAGGSGLATCIGAVANGAALSTSTAGPHTFTVDATDNAGNPSSATTYYTVLADTTAPTISIVTPADGATFTVGQAVNASYSCADTGGSGLVTCIGSVGNGAAIDTASAGTKAFTVTATDQAGNTNSKVVHYTVAVPPSTGSFTVKGEGKVGKDFKFQIDAKTGTKKPSGEVEIDVKGHSFQGTVIAITITGSTAVLTGTGFDNGRRVNFTLTVTDGGNNAKDTLTVTFGTYTGGGVVTDGDLRIRQSSNDG
jgi:lipopolysaccharide export system protein LptA